MDIAILDYCRADDDPARALVKALSRVPDLGPAEAGDLILTSRQPMHPNGMAIITGQSVRLGYTWVNAGWTHAAIYTGIDYCMVEATPEHGVAESDLRDYLPDHLIRFRRLRSFSREQRRRIAERALSMVGDAQYNKLKLAACAYTGKKWDIWNLPFVRDGHICSSLFTRIVDELAETRHGLFRWTSDPPVPALLSRSTELVDVEIRWQR